MGRIAALQLMCLLTSVLLAVSVIGRAANIIETSTNFVNIGAVVAVGLSLTMDTFLIVISLAACIKLQRFLLVVSQRLTIISSILCFGCLLMASFLGSSMLMIFAVCLALLVSHGISLFILTLALFPVTFVPEFSTP